MKIMIYDKTGKREVKPFTLASDNEIIPQGNN